MQMYKLLTQGFTLGFAAPRFQRSTSFALVRRTCPYMAEMSGVSHPGFHPGLRCAALSALDIARFSPDSEIGDDAIKSAEGATQPSPG